MALSAKERMQRFRAKLKQQDKIPVRAMLSRQIHLRLKRQAARKGLPLIQHVLAILTRASKG